MNNHAIYQQRRSANQLGAILLVSSVVGFITAALALLSAGFLAGFAVLLLSLVVFALARLLDIIGELVFLLARWEEKTAAAEGRSSHRSASSVTT